MKMGSVDVDMGFMVGVVVNPSPLGEGEGSRRQLMKLYRKGNHSKDDLKVHLVWITKYRKKVLHGEVARKLRVT